jgi:hypothetical protein
MAIKRYDAYIERANSTIQTFVGRFFCIFVALLAPYLFHWSAYNCCCLLPILFPLNFNIFLLIEVFGPGAQKLRASIRAQFGVEREFAGYIIGAVTWHVIFHAGMYFLLNA